jgi:CRISPR-associated endonuclease Csn1
VINKTVNKYQHFENGKKVIAIQTKGDSWAIRKPMHKETVSGKVKIRLKKTVQLSIALDVWQTIVDKSLKNQIKVLVNQGFDKAKLVKFFKEIEYKWNEKDISKVEIYYFNDECAASRTKIDESFNSKAIESVTDSGIKQILNRHLEKYESAELAFSSDGLEQMNLNIVELNNGVFHKPIYKVRTFEPIGNKFAVGQTGNKKDKFVEAAKGTNLFFAIYVNAEGKRTYETIQLNIVIERQKQGLSSAPEKNEKGDNLLFLLSPSDLVYVPTKEEIENYSLVDFNKLNKDQTNRISKMVSSTGTQCFFINNNVSSSIWNKLEFSALNKMEKTIDGIMIKEVCWKLTVNRLGQIIKVNH